MTAVMEEAAARALVSPDLFNRLATRIVQDKGTERALAERIVEQALAFLGACAEQGRGAALVPSAAVDIGWHTFILHTRDYAAFCEQVAGFFIHHVPSGDDAESGDPAEVLGGTVNAIQRAGYLVDPELWDPTMSRCGPCYEEGNCAASGKHGDENKENRKQDD